MGEQFEQEVPMALVQVLFTARIGQLTGSTDLFMAQPKWPLLVDAERWPLLNDTGRWGALGLDLGANTVHNGRTYIFFGDVASKDWDRMPLNADMVAWIDEPEVLRHGGHLALGWNFMLPFEPTSIQGQPDWRFCGKCGALFWDGDPNFKGVCHRGGIHEAIGLRFVIPAKEMGAQTGQPDWRFCGKCASLFWNGDPNFKGVCPKDGAPHSPTGWNFLIPAEELGAQTGQPEWRFCGKCAGLFWDGHAHKGICMGAPGGGFHLNAVLREDGWFDPFTGTDPIGLTLSLETPNGAFSYAGKVWVFAGFSDPQFSGHPRPGNPQPGCYLTSKSEPDKPGPFQKEFLFSPRIGACPRDASRDRLESHVPLGFKFVLSHDIPDGSNRQANFRFCGKCATLFWDGDPNFKGFCHRGSSHEATGFNYVLTHSIAEDDQHQSNWCQCSKCASVFWNGDANNRGLCAAGGEHEATGFNFVLAHDIPEDEHNQGKWRFCIKCHCAVWTGQEDLFSWVAPCVVDNAHHPGLPESPWAQGLVMFGFCYSGKPGIRLAWMPLKHPTEPMLQDILYYTGNATAPWSPNVEQAAAILPHTNTYTHLSAAWLEGAQKWILLYSNANDETGPEGLHQPAVARIGTSLWEWSAEIEIFNPFTQGAYGVYMHQVGHPYHIHPDIPPSQDPNKPEHDGWAYGAFLLNHFTEWNVTTRELDIYYLLSLSSPYQVQLMHTRLRLLDELTHHSTTRHLKLFHGGNGTTPVDSGLPLQGIFYGVTTDGNLEWNRYNGRGEQVGDPASVQSWHPHTGNLIGRGWQHMLHIFGCGDGVIMAIHPNGNLHWYLYDGNGESDVTGALGWHPNSGNAIGNGWQNFLRLFVFPQAGRSTSRLKIFAVAANGDLHWYSYNGFGEHDPSGASGWHPNSGNRVGNGWQNFRHIHGSGNVVFAVHENGDLLWYSYSGKGEDDVSGASGWHPNSGNPIGRGWQNMQHIFGGVTDLGEFGHVIMAVDQNGDLFWYKYTGQGESDVTGSTGWHPRSGNRIGTGW
jgi:Tachylectin